MIIWDETPPPPPPHVAWQQAAYYAALVADGLVAPVEKLLPPAGSLGAAIAKLQAHYQPACACSLYQAIGACKHLQGGLKARVPVVVQFAKDYAAWLHAEGKDPAGYRCVLTAEDLLGYHGPVVCLVREGRRPAAREKFYDGVFFHEQ